MKRLCKSGMTVLILGLILGININPTEADITKEPSTGPVKVEGRQLKVDFDGDGAYVPYLIKGVGYNPHPIGTFPSEWGTCEYVGGENPINCDVVDVYDRPELMDRDFPLLRNMYANTIRTWEEATINLLDKAEEKGIKVIAGFWIHSTGPSCVNGEPEYHPPEYYENYATILNNFEDYVRRLKDVNDVDDDGDIIETHPAILFWAIGNENNLHLNPSNTTQIRAWYSLVNEMAEAAHYAEGPDYHPVAVVNGDLEFIGMLGYGTDDNSMMFLDIWGANVYRGNSFGAGENSLFYQFANLSDKPLWISEYGVDAYHTNDPFGDPAIGQENQQVQAQWVGALWNEIYANRSRSDSGVCTGATIMEYSDEWWGQDEWTEDVATQDHNGIGPVDRSCPPDGFFDWYPPSLDNYFNGEWWGIMKIEKNDAIGAPDVMLPRQVYYTLQSRFRGYVIRHPEQNER